MRVPKLTVFIGELTIFEGMTCFVMSSVGVMGNFP